MAHQHKSFAIIGLGTFGSTVAAELVRFGNHVLGIDIDEKRVSRMAHTLSEAMIADGRDELALREIARNAPQTLTALRAISGVGDKKLDSYGAEILQLIAELNAG